MLQRVGIGARIAGGSFVIALLICAAVGLVLNSRIEQILRTGTDTVLTNTAATYSEAIRSEPDESFDSPGPAQQVAVINPQGDMQVDTLPAGVSSQVLNRSVQAGTSEVSTDKGDFIVKLERVTTSQGIWQVVVSRPAEEEQALLEQMRTLIVVTMAIIACGVLVTALLLTSASLRPVRRIRQTAERLIDAPGDDALPVGPADDEISSLARTLNELISKLRASAQRERQMVSDASHELRTPLAILRSRLELARSTPHSVDELMSDVEGAERSTRRLTRIVESLLTLSTIEASGPTSASVVEVVDEVKDAVDRAVFRAQGSSVDINENLQIDDGRVAVSVRAHDLGRVVDNLLANSLHAVGAGGTIDVVLQASATGLVLTVDDSGGGMPEDFVERAFDRFSRSDAAREAGEGTGLGLAIVAAIVQQAHGTIELKNRPGVGLSVLIELPSTIPEPSTVQAPGTVPEPSTDQAPRRTAD